MISKPKSDANRLNAQKSTGPRTTRGKRRSSRNALRHGLSVVSFVDPDTEAKIQQLTTLIAQGASGDYAVFIRAQARALAEAEIVSSHIMAKRLSHLERLVSDRQSISATGRTTEQSQRALSLLLSMERYDERASSRGRRAMRNLCDMGHGTMSEDHPRSDG